MQKKVQYIIKGMQRDLSISKASSEFSFENHNIRITAREDNTLLSITNEKGNKQVILNSTITGYILGHCVLNKYVVLFSVLGDTSYIYRIKNNEGTYEIVTLYTGNLNFNAEYPIETLGIFENKNIQKVYWTDGLNQPRVINIADVNNTRVSWNNYSFDFVQRLKLKEEVTVTKNTVASGSFSPGVIQYAFTYYNLYGQESNIFYTSPLNYISFNNRGCSPEDKVGNSFTINIKATDNNFDYIRIYSIHRTSIDATPTVKRVADLGVQEEVYYIDNGRAGDTIDPTQLLYIGGEETVAGTITHKDNTLFLGNLKIKRSLIPENIRNSFRNLSLAFYYPEKEININSNVEGYYPYESQLKYNSRQIKNFKYLETYRFGVQFQHYSGKWSEPIWVKDVRNNVRPNIPYCKEGVIRHAIVSKLFNDRNIINQLVDLGYIKVRPVIVYPELSDRESVCQGVLCPTVFNVEDRNTNSPSSQSSWFTRPNPAFSDQHDPSLNDFRDRITGEGDFLNASNAFTAKLFLNSRAGILRNNATGMVVSGIPTIMVDSVSQGATLECRHNEGIQGSGYTDNNEFKASRMGEIQCIYNHSKHPKSPVNNNSEWLSKHENNYFIDQSVVTLHSPEIEFNTDIRSIDSSNLKLRIVGITPITSSISDIDIQTKTPPNLYKGTTIEAPGFYKENIGSTNISRAGYKVLSNGVFWLDAIKDISTLGKAQGFVVFPWHRNGSLNNTRDKDDSGNKSAFLDKKKMSNIRYSLNSFYFDSGKIWNAYVKNSSTRQGISGIKIFDSNEITLTKLPAPKNSGHTDITYYGNVDKIVTAINSKEQKDGYPILTTGYDETTSSAYNIFRGEYQKATDVNKWYSTDPVRMKYKSTPHAVLALNYSSNKKQIILPTLYDGDVISSNSYTKWAINPRSETFSNNEKLFWEKEKSTIGTHQDIIDYNFFSINGSFNNSGYGPEYGYLWLAELYNDTITEETRFGGTSSEALENNKWIPCGKANFLDKSLSSVEIVWEEGDTYYQRYDHLKTYPFTLEDQNSMVDIISFMCETRINLDGRYDKNRGQYSNLVTSPTNFNLMNDVYSQNDNFFTYRALNYNKFNLDSFPNSITWTKEKALGEDVDTWTNITLASLLDLDGDKGSITSLNTFNNEIFCFQEKGISNILFNSRVQIPTSDGMPIEISNGLKVNGKRYISNSIGCFNKWSITQTPFGIYFIDNYTSSIYLFNGQQLSSLTDSLGFKQWLEDNLILTSWNPKDFENFISFYDSNNKDIYFVNKDTALCYSESLGQFVSFMDYGKIPSMFNIEDSFYSIQKGNLWEQNVGDYNMFYNEFKPYSITYRVNPEGFTDKVFNNIEYMADSWNKEGILNNNTFDKLYTWNEYQSGETSLEDIKGRPSSLKKKFRIWRANIPRDKSNNRDRIRNPWVYLKIAKEKENTDKLILHNMVINYFD